MTAHGDLALPSEWQEDLEGYGLQRQTIGRSGAIVLRLEAEGRPSLFAKSEIAGPFAELPGEELRLKWLARQAIAAPRALARTVANGRNWLLMSALPGRDLASAADLPPGLVVELTADALRRLHRLDPALCPFDHRLDRRIAAAQVRAEAGIVDETDFDEERLGRTAVDLFEELVRRRPKGEDLVVTHGDACLPNLLVHDGRLAGFVDCARLGVADRHQDLALSCWSVRYNLGEAWVGPFLQRYGIQADPERLDYYRLLDEFF
jgi:aminoglycoside 3'-phosphotransferase-2